MSNFNINYQNSINTLKGNFLQRLILASAFIAIIFFFHFTFGLKLASVGIVKLCFAAVFFLTRQLFLKKKIDYNLTVNLWIFTVFVLLGIASYLAGGLRAAGVFWFPAIVFSSSILLDKNSMKRWLFACASLMIIFLGVHLSGIEIISLQSEAMRPIAHFVNVSLIFFYVYCFSLLSLKLKNEVENVNHRILKDLYQENRLNNLSEIVGGVAHEINNPLAISSGSLLLLEKNLEKRNLLQDEILTKQIDKMKRAEKRITSVVKNLNAFNNKEKSEIQDFNLYSILEETIGFLENECRKREVDINFNSDIKEVLICGVPNKVQQIFFNIIKNAIHAIEESDLKTIEVSLLHKTDHFEVVVADNGVGIAKDQLEKVFDPFFTTKEVGKGSGLGLGICRSIIKEMGGDIQIDSELGVGTSVKIIFLDSQSGSLKQTA